MTNDAITVTLDDELFFSALTPLIDQWHKNRRERKPENPKQNPFYKQENPPFQVSETPLTQTRKPK